MRLLSVLAVAVVVLVAGVVYAAASTGRPARKAMPTTLPPVTAPPASTAPPAPVWQVAWASAMAWAEPAQLVSNSTVRTLVSVPVDGSALRVRISNRFGNAPLVVGSATAARSAGGAALVAGTTVPIHFGGAVSVTVPAGGSVTSDPVPMAVTAPEILAVSLYVADRDTVTAHYPCCEPATPSFLALDGTGNLVTRTTPLGFAFPGPSRLVDALDVLRPDPPAGAAARGSIVVLGDSITDGFRSTARWTDFLQKRIDALPAAERVAVVNEGNTANALTPVIPSDATTGGGPPGIQRLSDDVLTLPGVSTVVLFLGTNDLFFGATAQSLIAGYQQAAAVAHAHGVRIVGVTLLPRLGSERWTPARQQELATVNQWLLTNHVLDGVIDLATPMADMYNGACRPTALFPPYDSGDHLHPNAAGDVAMADAVPPSVLGLPRLPLVPPLVVARPTPRCAGAPGIPPPVR
jgi:lysophospholipase L1-like esterase